MVIYEKTGAMLVGVFVGLAIWVGWAGFEAYKIVVGSQARPALRAIHAKLERSGNDGLYGCLFDRTCREQSVDGFGDYPWYVGLGAGFVILGLVAGSIIGEETTVKAPAGASFAVEENLKPFIAGKYGYLGVIPSGKMLSWIKDLLYNMVVTGNPGAGKSSRFLKPLIIKAAFDGLSSVIWDMKPGDLDGGFEDLVEDYHALNLGGFSLKPMSHDSVSVDVLEGIVSYADAMDLCEKLIPQADKEEVEFYREAERAILSNLIVDAVNRGQHLEYVYWHCKSGVKEFRKYVVNDPRMHNRLATTLDRNSDKLSGLLDHIANRLEIFCIPEVARALCGMGEQRFDLRSAFRSQNMLYIGIPKDIAASPRGAYMARLIWRMVHQAVDSVIAETKLKKLKNPCAMVVDELPNWPAFHDLESRVSNMRGSGVCYLLAFQNFSQGYSKYGEYKFNAILEACQFTVYFPHLLSDNDKFKLEKILGDTVVIDASVGKGSNTVGTSQHRQFRHFKVPLLPASEMSTFPDGWSIVVGPRTKPIKVSLPHVTNTRHPYFEVYRDLQKLKQKTKPARTLNDTNTTNLQSLQHPAGGLRNSQDETSSQRRFPAREPTPQDQLALKRLVLDACEQGRAHLLTLSNTMIGVELFGVVLGSNQLIEVDWVEVVPEKIIVNRAGIEQLEEQYQRRLRQLARASSLREWLESNGRFVFGHVQFGNGEIRGKLEDDGRLFLNLEDALAISGKGATRLKHIQTVNINAQEYRLHPFNLKVDISDLKRLLKEEPKEIQTESRVAA